MIMIDKILYIDPGTGSMLFSIIIGIAGVLVFAVRALWIKFKFVITGGRSKASDSSTMPICIFSEGKRYWNVFSPICDEFEKRQKDIWYLTASSDDPALSKDYKYVHPKFIGEGNKALSKMNLIKADIAGTNVKISMIISTRFGYPIPATCQAVQSRVKQSVENMTGLNVTDVNIRVSGVEI